GFQRVLAGGSSLPVWTHRAVAKYALVMVVRSFCSLRVSSDSSEFCSRRLFWLRRVKGRACPQAALRDRRARSRRGCGNDLSAVDGKNSPQSISASVSNGLANLGQVCPLVAPSAVVAGRPRYGT